MVLEEARPSFELSQLDARVCCNNLGERVEWLKVGGLMGAPLPAVGVAARLNEH